ncbi:MAG: DUF1256 domain-containing protein [Lachnospiraceae bacterium]
MQALPIPQSLLWKLSSNFHKKRFFRYRTCPSMHRKCTVRPVTKLQVRWSAVPGRTAAGAKRPVFGTLKMPVHASHLEGKTIDADPSAIFLTFVDCRRQSLKQKNTTLRLARKSCPGKFMSTKSDSRFGDFLVTGIVKASFLRSSHLVLQSTRLSAVMFVSISPRSLGAHGSSQRL